MQLSCESNMFEPRTSTPASLLSRVTSETSLFRLSSIVKTIRPQMPPRARWVAGTIVRQCRVLKLTKRETHARRLYHSVKARR